MLKKLMIHTRKGIKMIILLLISIFIILGILAFLYKPTYSVYIAGEQVGYTENRASLQQKINDFVNHGDGNEKNVAFVQVENLPQYKMCLLKKDIVTNDEEIYNKVKEQGIEYYRYYAILDNNEEKYYVSNFEEAENVINTLKEKNSTNKDSVSIAEKYETELKDLVSTEEAVSKLYIEPPKITVASTRSSSSKYKTSGTVDTSSNTSTAKAKLGISLIKPVSGIITSKFGAGSAIRRASHTGLDIATSTGTPIVAAAGGTVTFSGYKGSYGNMIVISHGNGVQTYYAHCSKLYVSAGTSVTQGQKIAAVGNTGNSTRSTFTFRNKSKWSSI